MKNKTIKLIRKLAQTIEAQHKEIVILRGLQKERKEKKERGS